MNGQPDMRNYAIRPKLFEMPTERSNGLILCLNTDCKSSSPLVTREPDGTRLTNHTLNTVG